MSIRRQCALLGISRSSVYYTPRAESAANLALMRRMDALSLQYPFYGSRQMARHLRREGVLVGRRRVRRLMRLMGLEALYRRPRTSGSQPGHRIYPYLLRDLTIDRPDQVWCADITYIPVTAGFLYLVAIMDWASRHVLSWRLSNTMDTGFCVEALEAALRTGTPDIFNTDQGSQFTSAAFTERVLAAGAQCSMDGRGRCLDNVFIERLWRSLKYEAVYLHELADGFAAERVIGGMDDVLRQRTSALGARGPHAGRGLRRGAGSVSMRAAESRTLTAGSAFNEPVWATVLLDRRLSQATMIGIKGEGCRPGEQTHAVLLGRRTFVAPPADEGRQLKAGPLSMSHRTLWICPSRGRPLSVAPTPEVGEAGAHRPLEISRAIVAAHACVGAARFPQLHSASSSSITRHETDDEGVISEPEYTLGQ